MTDFENFVLIVSSGIDSKFRINRDERHKSLHCSADVSRYTSILKSADVVFVFSENTGKFKGITVQLQKSDSYK